MGIPFQLNYTRVPKFPLSTLLCLRNNMKLEKYFRLHNRWQKGLEEMYIFKIFLLIQYINQIYNVHI